VPLNLDVMRLISVAVFLLIYGCAGTRNSTVAEACGTQPAAGWIRLSPPPPNAEGLLDLAAKDLGPKPDNFDDTWYRSSDGSLRYCRYKPYANPCKVSPETADFTVEQGAWRSGTVLVTVCVDANKANKTAAARKKSNLGGA
jgi:hypothetical protein